MAEATFSSQLEQPPVPSTDVFRYIFYEGRDSYDSDKVLYTVEGTDESLTFAQLEEQSRRFAVVLRDRYGVGPNDAVSILSKNRLEYPVVFFGAVAAGATVALIPVQSGMSHEDVASRMVQSKSKVLITDNALFEMASDAARLANNTPLMSMDKCGDASVGHVGSAIKEAKLPEEAVFTLKSPEEAGNIDAFVNRTSGSTGAMKSVLTTHRHYIATMEGTRRTVPDNTDPSKDVWLASSSLGFFINAKLFMSLNILLGVPVVIMPDPLDESNVEIIAQRAITFLLIFPPLLAQLSKADLSTIDMSSMKWLLSAGASIPDNLRQSFLQHFPGLDLTLEWGTSETMLIAIQTDAPESRRRGSSGVLVNGMEARVISTDDGANLGAGEKGEILVRNSLAPFKGYKDNEAANKDFDSHGWFHTGDYGYLDDECNVYIIDRLKELLRVGDGYGSRISVSELENAVFEHDAVRSVVVVGVQDDSTATLRPTAFVKVVEDAKYTAGRALADEILSFTASRLTGLKSLTGGVFFVDDYPMTGFKINRRALKTVAVDSESHTVPSCMRQKREDSPLSP